MKGNGLFFNLKLDVDPRRDDDASPSHHRGHIETKVISALRHKSKFEFQKKKKLKKIKLIGLHAVVLVKTFPLMYQLQMYD